MITSRTLDIIKVLIGGVLLTAAGRYLLDATIATYKSNDEVIVPAIIVGIIGILMFIGGVVAVLAALFEASKGQAREMLYQCWLPLLTATVMVSYSLHMLEHDRLFSAIIWGFNALVCLWISFSNYRSLKKAAPPVSAERSAP